MFPCYANKTGASLLGRIMACLIARRFAVLFSFSKGRAAGVWGLACRPSNKKCQAIDAQIIGVHLQVTPLHSERLRKILRSLKKIFLIKKKNSDSLGNVSMGRTLHRDLSFYLAVLSAV